MALIVLGAGIVGLTCANLLAMDLEQEIILIDTKAPIFDYDKKFYDLRCSAINHASKNIFEHLKIWDAIVEHRAGVYKRMVVWDQLEHNQITFDSDSLALQNLGYILENRVILQELWRKINTCKNVRQIYGVASDLQIRDNQVYLQLNDMQISADLIIGADGANSWLRNAASINCQEHNYQQQAIVATVHSQLPHQNTAWQRFTPTGNLAFLPLNDPYKSSIVWVSSYPETQQLVNMEEETFCKNLAAAFDYKLGALQLHGTRASFQLRRQDAARYIAARVALIGDAAHVMHPMAGQGLNTGLHDAKMIAKCLAEARENNQDLGSEFVLRRYERNAKGANALVLGGVDKLHKCFAQQNPIISMLRGAGLRVLNDMVYAKKLMANIATGNYRKDFI